MEPPPAVIEPTILSLTEVQIFQFWAMGFAGGMTIVLAFWLIHIFKASSDWEGE